MTAPRLSAESRRLWRAIHGQWELAPQEDAILRVGLESLDLMRACQADLEHDGRTVTSRDGRKQHPSAVTLNAARGAFLAAMRALGFETPDATDRSPLARSANNYTRKGA